MARKSWSNLFLLLAAINLSLAVAPNNQFQLLAWAAFPLFIILGVYIRRRMI